MEQLLFSYEIDCVEVSGQRFIKKGMVIDKTLPEAAKTVSDIYGEDNIFEMKLAFIGSLEQQVIFELENIEK